MVTFNDFKSDIECAWCPGCGNFGILNSVKNAFVKMDMKPHEAVICTGIGQAPKLPHYMKVNTFNGLHGREITHAQGVKLANPQLKVIVHGGEGGIYGEGGNHFLHAIRRNIDITVVVHDNTIYGLTKGQASPTTEQGRITKVNPHGVFAQPLNPLALAISQSCSFVAQSFSGFGEHLSDILVQAINHKGFSYVNVLQPCVTWDKVHNFKFFKENTDKISESYDPYDRTKALQLVLENESLPLGILYRNNKPPYSDFIKVNQKVNFDLAGVKKIMEKFY
jgi:2-oxoglutarate/2-oxoacid ferredoxin oxidoreductase subunit beta